MKVKSSSSLATAILLGIVLGAWTLRVFRLGAQSLWVDEGFSWDVARQGPLAILRILPAEDRHPPLHYLLLWLTMQLAGSSEFSLRFLSACSGTLAVPLVFWLGRRFDGPVVGLLAAGLIVLSPFHVWYSQEARMYALLMTLGLVSVVCAARLVDRPSFSGHRWLSLGYVSSTAGALLTHYYGTFLLAAHLALIACAGGWRDRWRGWLLRFIVVAALAAPWLSAVWSQYQRAPRGQPVTTSLPTIVWNVATAYTVGENLVADADRLAAAAVALAIFGIVASPGDARSSRRERLSPGLALLAWVLAAPLGALALTLLLRIDVRASGRMYYLAGLPAFALLVARGMNGIRTALTLASARLPSATWRAIARSASIGALVVGLGAVVTRQQAILREQYFDRPKEDFRAAARSIEAQERPRDAIILDAEYIFHPFRYYYRGRAPWFRAVVEPGAVDAALAEQTAGHDRLWLVLSHAEFADPEQRVARWLGQHAAVLGDEWFAGVHLRLYGVQPDPPTRPPTIKRSLGVRFGDLLELRGVDAPERAVGGHPLPFTLLWHPLAHLAENDHAVLQLVDGDGQIWAQSDYVPIGPFNLPTQWQPGQYLLDYPSLAVPLGVPPGMYRLLLKLYAPSSGHALLAQNGRAEVELGSVQVDPSIPPYPLAGQDLAPRLRLVQASLEGKTFQPGDNVPIELLCQSLGSPAPSRNVVLRLVDDTGTVVATEQARNLPRFSQPNQVIRDRLQLRIPRRLSAGSYRVEAGIVSFETIGALTVAPIHRSTAIPSVTYPQEASFGDSIALLGFDLEPSAVRPGMSFQLTLYWKALNDPVEKYTVFTHLIGPDGRIHAQHDSQPAGGARPTSGWLSGEVIRDSHLLTVDPNAPPGRSILEIGWYQPASGVRLPVVKPPGQGDRLILIEGVDVEP